MAGEFPPAWFGLNKKDVKVSIPNDDLLEELIDRIAEAVVTKIDERRKIDAIAEAVLARLEERGEGLGVNRGEAEGKGRGKRGKGK